MASWYPGAQKCAPYETRQLRHRVAIYGDLIFADRHHSVAAQCIALLCTDALLQVCAINRAATSMCGWWM